MSTRPFHTGDDAAHAIAQLGLFGAVLRATRVVVTWENADLLTALSPHQGYPHALVAVEATMLGHSLTWQPFELAFGPENPDTGTPNCLATYGERECVSMAVLPAPIAAALRLWHRRVDLNPRAVMHTFEREGYQIRMAV